MAVHFLKTAILSGCKEKEDTINSNIFKFGHQWDFIEIWLES